MTLETVLAAQALLARSHLLVWRPLLNLPVRRASYGRHGQARLPPKRNVEEVAHRRASYRRHAVVGELLGLGGSRPLLLASAEGRELRREREASLFAKEEVYMSLERC